MVRVDLKVRQTIEGGKIFATAKDAIACMAIPEKKFSNYSNKFQREKKPRLRFIENR